MINAFRKIRRALINSDSPKKYLLYALGEILLIVMGILIALQINNWNEARIQKSIEREYIVSLKEQLSEDLEVLGNERNYNRWLMEQFEYAKEAIKKDDRSLQDTIARIAINMTEYADFRRGSNVYQTLVNSGEIRLLKNRNLKEQLQGLEQTYNYINRLEESHEQAILQLVVDQIRIPIKFDPFVVEKPDMLYSYVFQNNFSLLIDLMLEQEGIYDQAISEIEDILNLIKVDYPL